MRSHRESISLIKGETGTGAPVARADTRARIQRRGGNSCLFPTDGGGRLTTFHLRYRRAVYIPRRSPSVSLSPYPPCLLVSRRPIARAPIIPPYLRTGEPLSRELRNRSSVDYFSKSSGSRIFKWRLNETGSLPPPSPDSPPASPIRSSARGCLHP